MSQHIIEIGQMYTPISIMFPMPAVIIQVPVGHGQHNGHNFTCTACGQSYEINIKEETVDVKQMVDVEQKTVDVKQEMVDVKQEMVDVKQEMVDVKQEMVDPKQQLIDIKEAFDIDYEMNEYILNKDANLYESILSSVSDDQFEDEVCNGISVSEHEDESYYNFYIENFEKINAIITYLKQGIIE